MTLEAKAQEFIDAAAAEGGPPIYTLTPDEARQVLEKAQADVTDAFPADVRDLSLPAGPAGRVDVRIVKPTGSLTNLPVIVYFHGGGWILGSARTHDRLVRELAVSTNAAVVFVKYTPSPEARYPIPLEECYAATAYVAEHGDELGVDGSQLVVAGDSVGGNMAAVVAMLAKERGGPTIAFQLLFYPVTDAAMNTASYAQFADGPWLTKPAMEWFWKAYAPDVESRLNVTASPLRASTEQLTGLPPALIITAENDVLRDEGEAYAAKLIEAGVTVTAIRFLGTIHDFVMLNNLAESNAARGAMDLAVEKLTAVFA